MEPKRGGKVPEAAKDPERIELNKQDAAGLNNDQDDVQQNEIFDSSFDNSGFFSSPFNDEDYGADFPSFDPIKISGSSGSNYAIEDSQYNNPYAVMYDSLFKKPSSKPPKSKKKSSKDTYKYVDIDSPPAKNDYSYQEPYRPYIESPAYDAPYQEPPSYDYSPNYDYSPPKNDFYSPPPPPTYDAPYQEPPSYDYSPHNDYSPPSYEAPYEPEPYLPPKPVGPVLLEKRPYEVKSVQPLPITVAESYTSFDCRTKHPGRHYADPEAGCQVILRNGHRSLHPLLDLNKTTTFS